MRLYPDRLNRDFKATDENSKIQEAYQKVIDQSTYLNEDSTEDAKKTLSAIINALKDDKDNDILKQAKGTMESYKKNKGFSVEQAKWIYNTSKALFKK